MRKRRISMREGGREGGRERERERGGERKRGEEGEGDDPHSQSGVIDDKQFHVLSQLS